MDRQVVKADLQKSIEASMSVIVARNIVDGGKIEFHTMDHEKMALVARRMGEIDRATRAFGKRNSQAMSKLMTISMLSQSPLRRLRQCLAEIEKKRAALKENIFDLKRDQIELRRIQASGGGPDENVFVKELRQIDMEELSSRISDRSIYIEGALKAIGAFQDAYDEIKAAYNIPDNWDEKDFEEAEIEHHIKMAILHAVRDVEVTGRIGMGTHEYLEQFGMNPHTVYIKVRQFLHCQEEDAMETANSPELYSSQDISMLYRFIDGLYEVFKDEYKKAMDRLGLKNLISGNFLYRDEIGK